MIGRAILVAGALANASRRGRGGCPAGGFSGGSPSGSADRGHASSVGRASGVGRAASVRDAARARAFAAAAATAQPDASRGKKDECRSQAKLLHSRLLHYLRCGVRRTYPARQGTSRQNFVEILGLLCCRVKTNVAELGGGSAGVRDVGHRLASNASWKFAAGSSRRGGRPVPPPATRPASFELARGGASSASRISSPHSQIAPACSSAEPFPPCLGQIPDAR